MLYHLLFVHWLADFVAQTDWMALNKASNWKALLTHTLVYAGIFLLLIPLQVAPARPWLVFVGVTFVTHTVIDAVSSRLTASRWKAGDRRGFFIAVGFDQFLHVVQLAATAQALGLM